MSVSADPVDPLLDRFLPLVRDRFFDPHTGGFHEQLDQDGRPEAVPGRRVLAQCRLLYVLAQAAVLGDQSGTNAAEAGYCYLRKAYADPAHGGWYFRVDETDRHKDFYAHAFVLFALGWLHRAFRAPDALELAATTYQTMQERLAAPHGGFWESATEDWRPLPAVRRQNPHMHLLEAFHALYEASGNLFWLDEADRIIELFRDSFFDRNSATLSEFLTDDLRPHALQGHIVEPGHHFEWVWLLHRHAALTGKTLEPAANALFETACRHGFDPRSGGIYDQIDRRGNPLIQTRRLWPVTEAIKACTARQSAGLTVPEGQPHGLVEQLENCFIRPAQVGWIERLDPSGAPLQTSLPGTTPYHVVLALAAMKRAGRGKSG